MVHSLYFKYMIKSLAIKVITPEKINPCPGGQLPGLQPSGGPELGGMSRGLPMEPWLKLVTGPGPLDGGTEVGPRFDALEDDGSIFEDDADFRGPEVGSGSPRG